MAKLLVVAHSPLASALREVAAHAFPGCGGSLEAVDITAGLSIDEAQRRVADALAGWDGSDVLILADVFGATPCNAAQRAADGVRVRVVAGVNVPMLWRSLCYAAEPLESLVERALGGGAQGLMQAGSAPPQHQGRSPQDSHAQGHRHDQQ